MFVSDWIFDNKGHGSVGEQMQQVRFDSGMLRPWVGRDGRSYVTVNTGRMLPPKDGRGRPFPEKKNVLLADLHRQGVVTPTVNSSLPKDTWIEIDRTVTRVYRSRLRAWADLMNSSQKSGFNAMAKTTLEYQAMTDPGEAVMDMDGMTDARNDRPLFNLRSIPLPITHSDFWVSSRELAVSRNNGGLGLDTTMLEAAARRVAEMVERVTIGTEAGLTYGTVSAGPNTHTGTSTIYGYTNHPQRILKTDLNAPTGSNPEAVLADILEMIQLLQDAGFYGPYMLYHSTPYSRYLADDYFRTGSTSAVRSLRQRLLETEDLMDIRRLDYLTSGYQLILVQMSPDVAQAINGMDVTTVQWETKGGMQLNFKIMAIQVPLIKTPYNGVAGIVHGTTS